MNENIISNKQLILEKMLRDLPVKVTYYQTCSSTSELAKNALKIAGYRESQLIMSEQQTAGYGKKGRRFISQTGGLYLSLIVQLPQLTGQNQGLLTTGIAYCLHEAIREELGITTEIKWVNDLLLHGKKIAGILVEECLPQVVVIGIGCNLYQANLVQQLPSSGNLLAKAASDAVMCKLTANLVHKIFLMLPEFHLGEFLPAYKRQLSLLGQEVTVQIGNQRLVGRAIDLNQQANLILRTAKGLITVGAGEVVKVRQM